MSTKYLNSSDYDDITGINTIRTGVQELNELDFSLDSWKHILEVLELIKFQIADVIHYGNGKKALLGIDLYKLTAVSAGKLTKERTGIFNTESGKVRVIKPLEDIELGKPAMIDGTLTIRGSKNYIGIAILPRKETEEMMRKVYGRVILWHISKDRELRNNKKAA